MVSTKTLLLKYYYRRQGHPPSASPAHPPKPKGRFRTKNSTESDSVVFYYSVVKLLRVVIHYSKYSKSVQNVVLHYIFSSESLSVVNSLQIVNSLRVLFLVCRGPLGTRQPLGGRRWSHGWGSWLKIRRFAYPRHLHWNSGECWGPLPELWCGEM